MEQIHSVGLNNRILVLEVKFNQPRRQCENEAMRPCNPRENSIASPITSTATSSKARREWQLEPRSLQSASKNAQSQDVFEVQRRVLLGLTIFAGAWLRFHLLAHKSFWFDEGFSVGVARLDWTNLLHLLWVREANMALYYVLLKLWLGFGISEFYVRSLSLVFGLAAIPMVYALGARLFGARTGLIAAFLLSINAFHVRYSQEARAYTLLVFLSALCSWLWVRCIDDPAPRNWRLYTVASLLTVYSHFYGVLVVMAHWLSLGLLPPAMRPRAAVLRWLRFFAYGVLPLVIVVWRVGAQPMNWLARPDSAIMRHFFESLAGNGGYKLLGLYVLSWIAAADGLRRSDRSQRWRYHVLLLWLAFPIVAVFAVSQYKSIFLARYLIACLPASVLLAAAGIARLRGIAQAGMLLVIGILSIGGVFSYYQRDFDVGRDDWRAATQYVLANAQPGDGIFFYTAPGRMSFEYYRLLSGTASKHPEVIYPTSGERMTYRDFLTTPLGEVLQSSLPQPKRVWVFLNDHRPRGHMDMGSEVVCAWYGKRYRLLSKTSIDELDVLLYADEH